MRSIDLFPSTDDDSNESEPSVEEVVIPDSFPSDFPLYPSGKVDSAFEGVQGNFLVSAKTADAPTEVYTWYLAELERNGWNVDQKLDRAIQAGAFANISCSKGDLVGRMTATDDGSPIGTVIMITVTPAP